MSNNFVTVRDIGYSEKKYGDICQFLRDTCLFRVATVREKVLENEKFSRSGKSQGITFSVREI